jgi:MFS family permease
MLRSSLLVLSLFLGTAILLLGIGLQSTLISLRATLEQFSLNTIGLVMSAYFFGFILGGYLCPPLIRRVGHIRAFTVMASIASAAAVAYPIWVDPVFWAFLRLLTGICMMGLYMVIESWLNSVAPNTHRGQIFSIYIAITLLAIAGGQYLLLLAEVGSYELFGIAAILLSLALIPVAITRLSQPELTESARLKLTALYKISPLGVIGALSTGLVMGAFWGLAPVYAANIGLDTAGVAGLMSAAIVGGVVLQWPIGLISDRIDRRKVLGLATLMAAIMSLLAYLLGQSVSIPLYIVAFVFGGFVFSLYGLSVAHTNDQLEKVQILEATRGLLQLYGVGAMLGPVLAGQAMGLFGPGALPLYFSLMLGLLLLFTYYRMQKREAPPVEEQGEYVTMSRTSPIVLEMSPLLDQGEKDKEEGAEAESNHGMPSRKDFEPDS